MIFLLLLRSYANCTPSCMVLMFNGICDPQCNLIECFYDNYACEPECAEGCEISDVGNGICDLACTVEACEYDLNDCIEACSSTCTPQMVGDGICQEDCYNSFCEFDKGDCDSFCAPQCSFDLIGDGICQESCIDEACDFDENDCIQEIWVIEGNLGGDGSIEHPFGNLEKAFEEAEKNEISRIYLSGNIDWSSDISLNGTALILEGRDAVIKVKEGTHQMKFEEVRLWVNEVMVDGEEMWIESCEEDMCNFVQSYVCYAGEEDYCESCEGVLIEANNKMVIYGSNATFCETEKKKFFEFYNSEVHIDGLVVKNLDFIEHLFYLIDSSGYFEGMELIHSTLLSHMIYTEGTSRKLRSYEAISSRGSFNVGIFSWKSTEYEITIEDLLVDDINPVGCIDNESYCSSSVSPGILNTRYVNFVSVSDVSISNIRNTHLNEELDNHGMFFLQFFEKSYISEVHFRNVVMLGHGIIEIKFGYKKFHRLNEENLRITDITLEEGIMLDSPALIQIECTTEQMKGEISSLDFKEIYSYSGGVLSISIKEGSSEEAYIEIEEEFFELESRNFSIYDISLNESWFTKELVQTQFIGNFNVYDWDIENIYESYSNSLHKEFNSSALRRSYYSEEETCEFCFYLESSEQVSIKNIRVSNFSCEQGQLFYMDESHETNLSFLYLSSSFLSKLLAVEAEVETEIEIASIFLLNSSFSESLMLFEGKSEISIKDTEFSDYSNIILEIHNTKTYVERVSFKRIISDYSAIQIESEVLQLSVKDSIFEENFGNEAGDINIENSSEITFEITGTTFSKSQGENSVSVKIDEDIIIEEGVFSDCEFSEIESTSTIGIISLMYYEGDINFFNTTFQSITDTKGPHSIIFSYIGDHSSEQAATVTLKDCEFIENSAYSIMQQNIFQQQHLLISDCDFRGNFETQILIENSELRIEDTLFEENTNLEGNLIYVGANSYISEERTEYRNNHGSEVTHLIEITENSSINSMKIVNNYYPYSNLIVLEKNTIEIFDIEITGNICESIFDTNSIEMSIEEIVSHNNNCNYLFYMEHSTMLLSEASFDTEAEVFYIVNSEIALENISLLKTEIQLEDSTISLEDFELKRSGIVIEDSNLSAYEGLIEESSSNFSIRHSELNFSSIDFLHSPNSLFFYETNLVCTDILLSNSSSLLIQNGSFEMRNSEILSNFESSLVLEDSTGQIFSSIFHSNYGELGGCLSTEDSFLEIFSTDFLNNTAHQGGAIYQENSEITLFDCTLANNSAVHGEDFASNPIKLVPKYEYERVLRSGSTFTNLTFELFDEYQQVVVTNSETIFQLESLDLSTVITGQTNAFSENGVITFKDITVYHNPGENTTLLITSSESIETHYLFFEMRTCEIGEVQLEDNSCFICGNNTYSLSTTDTYCRPCPNEAVCLGGSEIFPSKGFWRTGYSDEVFYECPNPLACIGGTQKYSGDCEKGYTGNLCAICEESYMPSVGYTCVECPESAVSYVLVILGIVILLVLIVVMIIFKMKNYQKKSNDVPLLVKMMLNYVQTLMLFAAFNINWPENVRTLLNITLLAGNAGSELVSLKCSNTEIFGDIEITLQEIILVLLLPVIFAFIALIVWSGFALKNRSFYYLKTHLISTMVILGVLLHSSISNEIFSLYGCRKIGNESWMTRDYSIECWENNHLTVSTLIGIPVAFIWFLVIPLGTLIVLIRHRKHFNDEAIRIKYRTLLSGYTEAFFFWEIVIVYRKLLIRAVAVVFVDFSVIVQGLTAVSILSVMGYLQLSFKPFEKNNINKLEFASIMVCATSLLCGIFYSEDLGDNISIALSWGVMVLNIGFVLVWGMFFYKACVEAARENKFLMKVKKRIRVIKDRVIDSISPRKGSQKIIPDMTVAPFSVSQDFSIGNTVHFNSPLESENEEATPTLR